MLTLMHRQGVAYCLSPRPHEGEGRRVSVQCIAAHSTPSEHPPPPQPDALVYLCLGMPTDLYVNGCCASAYTTRWNGPTFTSLVNKQKPSGYKASGCETGFVSPLAVEVGTTLNTRDRDAS